MRDVDPILRLEEEFASLVTLGSTTNGFERNIRIFIGTNTLNFELTLS